MSFNRTKKTEPVSYFNECKKAVITTNYKNYCHEQSLRRSRAKAHPYFRQKPIINDGAHDIKSAETSQRTTHGPSKCFFNRLSHKTHKQQPSANYPQQPVLDTKANEQQSQINDNYLQQPLLNMNMGANEQPQQMSANYFFQQPMLSTATNNQQHEFKAPQQNNDFSCSVNDPHPQDTNALLVRAIKLLSMNQLHVQDNINLLFNNPGCAYGIASLLSELTREKFKITEELRGWISKNAVYAKYIAKVLCELRHINHPLTPSEWRFICDFREYAKDIAKAIGVAAKQDKLKAYNKKFEDIIAEVNAGQTPRARAYQSNNKPGPELFYTAYQYPQLHGAYSRIIDCDPSRTPIPYRKPF